MDENKVYSEFATFVRNTLGLYETGTDPSRLNGMWCRSVVKKGYCTYEELDEYLRYLADEIGDGAIFEYCMAPHAKMSDRDIAAIVKDNIFTGKYRLRRV